MSYRIMLQIAGEQGLVGNGQRFATFEEADDSACARAGRWTLVRGWRIDESEDPVNYGFVEGRDISLRVEVETAS